MRAVRSGNLLAGRLRIWPTSMRNPFFKRLYKKVMNSSSKNGGFKKYLIFLREVFIIFKNTEPVIKEVRVG
jgi:hypothetical protein